MKHESLAPRRPIHLLALALALPACIERPTDEMAAESSSSGSDDAMTPPGTDSGPGTTTTGDPSTTTSGDDGSSSDGSQTEDGSTTDDTTETGSEVYTVSGSVTRSVEPSEGNDAIGDLYVAVVDSCSLVPMVVGAEVVLADLSAPDASALYSIPDIPDGTWYFIAFLDDDQNAQLPEPSPESGDMVVSDGVGGLGCTEFVVDGGDVDGVDIDLNFVLF